jgi:Asp-tRNA(Asn)/Glu-tRNA(Gln) amidotransferase A subunit family amidase
MLPDLQTTLQKLHSSQITPIAEMEQSIAVAQSERCQHVFLRTGFDESRAVAAFPGVAHKPLAGLAVSVKDLFDVAGQTTSAGSLVLRDALPALSDSTAVARLRHAGAAFIGRTNMAEFAFSGVGINPHFGTPHNPGASDLPRVPGGSSSGAAVSVATGAAFIGLGSDTGGSIRIPAALCGVVGFKSTARLVPVNGVLPLSTTLDTVCALTRSVPDAMLVHEILAQRRVVRSPAPLAAYRLGVANTVMLDGLDKTVTQAWHRTLDMLRRTGARIDDIPLSEIDELQQIQASGGFSAAESYAWHHELLGSKKESYDPRVAARIERGASMSARDYIELLLARRKWIDRMTQRLQGFDAVLSPTVAVVAPPISDIAPGAPRDDAFFRTNALLLRNTSVVNMLDGCAISIPCHAAGELPVGLMVWAGALQDDPVLNIALEIENLLRQP